MLSDNLSEKMCPWQTVSITDWTARSVRSDIYWLPLQWVGESYLTAYDLIY